MKTIVDSVTRSLSDNIVILVVGDVELWSERHLILREQHLDLPPDLIVCPHLKVRLEEARNIAKILHVPILCVWSDSPSTYQTSKLIEYAKAVRGDVNWFADADLLREWDIEGCVMPSGSTIDEELVIASKTPYGVS